MVKQTVLFRKLRFPKQTASNLKMGLFQKLIVSVIMDLFLFAPQCKAGLIYGK